MKFVQTCHCQQTTQKNEWTTVNTSQSVLNLYLRGEKNMRSDENSRHLLQPGAWRPLQISRRAFTPNLTGLGHHKKWWHLTWHAETRPIIPIKPGNLAQFSSGSANGLWWWWKLMMMCWAICPLRWVDKWFVLQVNILHLMTWIVFNVVLIK